ncbi:hypothetical protein BKA69DRAFT_1076017 [Paraphysoderma sedebokerense]|nr:hypothetical protein BKA69DRAFT_1076017 [Paraphysoderma sedebokerense]
MYSLLLTAFTLSVLSAGISVFGAELESVSIEVSNADISSTIPNDNSANYCFKDVVCQTETDYIKEFKIEPIRWTLNKPVTLTFRTTDKSDRWRFVNLAVHQVLERESSNVPKHVFKGFILRGFPEMEVQPKKKYKATFVPPYFWKGGKYLLTLSLHKDGRVSIFKF